MPSKKLDFKTGQYVVYPTQGVGKLLRIEEQTIAGQKIKMMVIDFERNHMTLRVPLERAEISGLRPLTSVKKMDEAIASAKGRAGAKRMIWARRAAQYEENINSGDPMKLAEVVRDLQRRHNFFFHFIFICWIYNPVNHCPIRQCMFISAFDIQINMVTTWCYSNCFFPVDFI